jgi:hypothetical protein
MVSIGRVAAVCALLLATGCGVFRPAPTPFIHYPPLPAPEPFPDLTVDQLVGALQEQGLECGFTPDSDIPGGWSCTQDMAEPWGMDVGFTPEDGPILTLGASLNAYGDGSDPAANPPNPDEFDAMAAATFHRVLIVPVFGDAGPSVEELTTMVRDNAPRVVDDNWLLHFGRNSILRTMGLIYREP